MPRRRLDIGGAAEGGLGGATEVGGAEHKRPHGAEAGRGWRALAARRSEGNLRRAYALIFTFIPAVVGHGTNKNFCSGSNG